MTTLNDDPPARSKRQRSVFFDAVAKYEKLLEDAALETARLASEVETLRTQAIVQEEMLKSNLILIAELHAAQSAFLTSTSWRVTKPMRVAADLIRRGVGH